MSSRTTDPSFDDLVREVVAARDLRAHDDVASFLATMAPATDAGSTVTRAIRDAARADRIGYAFVAGYFAALTGLGGRAKRPAAFAGRRTAVAATEVAGAHPRNIVASVQARPGVGITLRGDKTFVTLADVADQLLVVARDGTSAPDERGRQKMVALIVPTDRDGVRIDPKPRTPFAPEIPHARVRFEDVAIEPDDLLAGDGWADWLKPFRTVEDTHVLAATASYLLGAAHRAGQLGAVAADLTSVLAVTLLIERGDAADVAGHLALEGAMRSVRHAFEALATGLDEASPERKRIARDATLLGVAQAARDKRTELAIRRISGLDA